jgi:hypothetical protein
MPKFLELGKWVWQWQGCKVGGAGHSGVFENAERENAERHFMGFAHRGMAGVQLVRLRCPEWRQ